MSNWCHSKIGEIGLFLLFSSVLTLSSSKKQYPLELESKKRKVEKRWRYSVRLYSQWESPVVGWLKGFAEEEYQLFNI